MKKAFLSFALIIFVTTTLSAQFGQNKVQYKEYDWYYIQTKHFDIFFSNDGKNIAEFTPTAAEDALEEISKDLKYQINNRIALIVYNSHNDFQETNTTDSYLSQGIGGFTEPFKNRVVFPFEGSFKKFRHVIHHELVHAVIRDMLYGGTVQNIIAKGITLQLPHWYHEGMAEYLSVGWETNTDMFIRDAIINEYLPDIERLGGYFGYRGGQSLFNYIAKKYGKEKVGELLNRIQGAGNVEAGFKATIGLSIEELNERWKKDLKKEYWPEIAFRDDPDEFAKRLTNNKKTIGFYNTSPAISPQGDKIVFISDRNIYLDIYVMNTLDGEIISRIAESGRTPDFEELNILTPSLTWAPDNKRVALAVKSSGYDVVRIIDTDDEDSYELPFHLDGIESVSWSPDGNYLALVGSNCDQSDIYLYNFETEELTNPINDFFSDSNPAWSPDSKFMYFSSDRGIYTSKEMVEDDFNMIDHNYDHIDLYQINIETKNIVRITDWEVSNEKTPVISPDGQEMLFVSDRNGIDNIYKKRIVLADEDTVDSITEIKAYPITNSLNGINQISLSADGKKLAFTSLFNSGYNIFMLTNPFEMESKGEELEPTNYMASLLNRSSTDETEIAEKKESSDDSTSSLLEYASISAITDDSVASKDRKTSIQIGQYINDKETDDDSTKTDYSNYVFGDNEKVTDSSNQIVNREELFKEKLDEDGNFLVNRYKINFSPDLIYANAGYSTFYGLLGTTVLSFSDVLGNHRLIGVTSLQIDLKNSDYGLAYYYLAKRIDYGIEAYHTARFVFLTSNNRSQLYRFRSFGGVLSANYPLNRFNRIELGLSFLNISSENLDDISVPSEKVTYFIPTLSFTHDNILWGYTSPIEGTRYRLSTFGNPGINDWKRNFFSVVWDYRTYFRFWFDNSFVFRLSGGFSGGNNPQRFFVGGTEYWINRRFATGDIPLSNASDFAFLTPGLPLRGFDYAEQIGTKYSLLNLELRMPLIRYLLTGPLPILLQNVLGVVFIDMGSAWDKTDKLNLFTKNEFGETVTKDLLIGTGVGVRAVLLFLWRLDVAWTYNVDKFSKPRYLLSFGLDF